MQFILTVEELLCVWQHLSLALRHPRLVGNPRVITSKVVGELGRSLVQWGVVTEGERVLVEGGPLAAGGDIAPPPPAS